MKQGRYKAIATNDLELPDSPQTWTKGLDYEAIIRECGTMELTSNEGNSYYTKQGIINILNSGLFEFIKTN